MVWEKNGTPDTLTGTADEITISDLTSQKSNAFLCHALPSGNIAVKMRFDGDTSGSVYADRRSVNGATDVTNSPNVSGWIDVDHNLANNTDDKFLVGYYADVPGQEKLAMIWNCDRHDAGAGTAPERVEGIGKYVPSPNADITETTIFNSATGDYGTDSNLSVLSDVVEAPAAVGGWVELGRTTLSSTSDTITVSGLSDKRYYMILSNPLGSGGGGVIRMGNGTIDTGTNYTFRREFNGGTDVTATTQTGIYSPTDGVPQFQVGYIANLSANEKLYQGEFTQRNTAGAANVPQRAQVAGKWVNTSNPLDNIGLFTTGNYLTDSELVVLGWDPTDTHTNNFWEELASVEITSASDTIDSGTITAKKYLRIQYYIDRSTTDQPFMTFNSDSASNYSERISLNGAADSTQVSQANFEIGNAAVANFPQFGNMFIINNSANEKLVIQRTVGQQGAAASIAPRRVEMVSKWTNTAAQITNITLGASAGNYNAPSFLKVWGSN